MSSTYNVYYNCTTHTDLRRRENELQHPTTKFYSQKCSLSKLISFTHFPLLLTSSSLPEIFSALISSTGWFDHPSLTEQVHTELRHVPGAESRFQSFYLVIKHTKYRMIHAIRRYLERASQVALVVKNLPANTGDHERHRFDPWVGKTFWSRKWQPTPVFLPGESHGERGLAGYSPWVCKELDMIEVTFHTLTSNFHRPEETKRNHDKMKCAVLDGFWNRKRT